MLKERLPFRSEGRLSRLEGWEKDPKKLWFPYFPEENQESPLFAHIIFFEHIRSGQAVPIDISDIMEFYAKRDAKGIQIAVDHWNYLAMIGKGPAPESILDKFISSVAHTFGEFSKQKRGVRSKLIRDALAFEDSIFSSVSVN